MAPSSPNTSSSSVELNTNTTASMSIPKARVIREIAAFRARLKLPMIDTKKKGVKPSSKLQQALTTLETTLSTGKQSDPQTAATHKQNLRDQVSALHEQLNTFTEQRNDSGWAYPLHIALTCAFPANGKSETEEWKVLKQETNDTISPVSHPLLDNDQLVPTQMGSLQTIDFVLATSHSWRDKIQALYRGKQLNPQLLSQKPILLGDNVSLSLEYLDYDYWSTTHQGISQADMQFWNQAFQKHQGLYIAIQPLLEHSIREKEHANALEYLEKEGKREQLQQSISTTKALGMEHYPTTFKIPTIQGDNVSQYIEQLLSNFSVSIRLMPPEIAAPVLVDAGPMKPQNSETFPAESYPWYSEYQQLKAQTTFQDFLASIELSETEFAKILGQADNPLRIILELQSESLLQFLRESIPSVGLNWRLLIPGDRLRDYIRLLNTTVDKWRAEMPPTIDDLVANHGLTQEETERLTPLKQLAQVCNMRLKNSFVQRILSNYPCHDLISMLINTGKLEQLIQDRRFGQINNLATNCYRNINCGQPNVPDTHEENIMLHAIACGLPWNDALFAEGIIKEQFRKWYSRLSASLLTEYGVAISKDTVAQEMIFSRLARLIQRANICDIPAILQKDTEQFTSGLWKELTQSNWLDMKAILSLSDTQIEAFNIINDRYEQSGIRDRSQSIAQTLEKQPTIKDRFIGNQFQGIAQVLENIEQLAAWRDKILGGETLYSDEDYITTLLVELSNIIQNLTSLESQALSGLADAGVPFLDTILVSRKARGKIYHDFNQAPQLKKEVRAALKVKNYSGTVEKVFAAINDVNKSKPLFKLTDIYSTTNTVINYMRRSPSIRWYYSQNLLTLQHLVLLTDKAFPEILDAKSYWRIDMQSKHAALKIEALQQSIQRHIPTDQRIQPLHIQKTTKAFQGVLPYYESPLLIKLLEQGILTKEQLIKNILDLEAEQRYNYHAAEKAWTENLASFSPNLGNIEDLLVEAFQKDPTSHDAAFSLPKFINTINQYVDNLNSEQFSHLLNQGFTPTTIIRTTEQQQETFSALQDKLGNNIPAEAISPLIQFSAHRHPEDFDQVIADLRVANQTLASNNARLFLGPTKRLPYEALYLSEHSLNTIRDSLHAIIKSFTPTEQPDLYSAFSSGVTKIARNTEAMEVIANKILFILQDAIIVALLTTRKCNVQNILRYLPTTYAQLQEIKPLLDSLQQNNEILQLANEYQYSDITQMVLAASRPTEQPFVELQHCIESIEAFSKDAKLEKCLQLKHIGVKFSVAINLSPRLLIIAGNQMDAVKASEKRQKRLAANLNSYVMRCFMAPGLVQNKQEAAIWLASSTTRHQLTDLVEELTEITEEESNPLEKWLEGMQSNRRHNSNDRTWTLDDWIQALERYIADQKATDAAPTFPSSKRTSRAPSQHNGHSGFWQSANGAIHPAPAHQQEDNATTSIHYTKPVENGKSRRRDGGPLPQPTKGKETERPHRGFFGFGLFSRSHQDPDLLPKRYRYHR
jgi:hypothetical protein